MLLYLDLVSGSLRGSGLRTAGSNYFTASQGQQQTLVDSVTSITHRCRFEVPRALELWESGSDLLSRALPLAFVSIVGWFVNFEFDQLFLSH